MNSRKNGRDGTRASSRIDGRAARTAAWLALALLMALATTGCTTIKRAAIRAEFRKAFDTVTAGTDLTQVAPNVYSYRWLSYRTAFVTTPEGVVLFDPLNEDAARGLAREIQRVAPNPEIKYVVYSHFHRDHASGVRALPGHPIIVAHANAVRDLALRPLPDVVPPTEVFSEEEHDIRLGGTVIELIHLPSSHTDGLVMAYLPAEKILYEVDIVWPHQLPPPGVPDMAFGGVRRATEMMLALDFDKLVPGHGDLGTKADVAAYHDFLADLEAAFRVALAAHGMADLSSQESFLRGKQDLADVLFDVEDALRPKYGAWDNYDAVILPTTQWCFWHVLIET
jgi:glyoxylase-like metal-dependent hydrolase (beta-lactamase superfamily II)